MSIFGDSLFRDVLADVFPEGVPDEREQEILEKMTDLLQKRLLLRAAQDLAGNKKDELDELLKKNDFNETSAFMERNVENLEEVLNEEVEKLKQEIKNYIQQEEK